MGAWFEDLHLKKYMTIVSVKKNASAMTTMTQLKND
jgi:hypothetical protein